LVLAFSACTSAIDPGNSGANNQGDTGEPIPVEIIFYTVSFDTMGGEPLLEDQIVEEDHTAYDPGLISKDGFTFTGWYTIVGVLWDFNEPVNENFTLYAWWEELPSGTYTVTFVAGSGTAPEQQFVGEGGKARDPGSVAKAGHSFEGWFTADGVLWIFEDEVTGPLILYARWIVNQYTVDFVTDGGEPEPEPQTLDYGEKIEKPEITKEGYKLTGWIYNGAVWDFDKDTISEDMTLYASWIVTPPDSFIVYFIVDGTTPEQQEVTNGGKATDPEITKKGHTLIGWFTDDGDAGLPWDFDKDTVTKTFILYSRWDVNQYTIKFDPVGGGPAPEDQIVSYNEYIKNPETVSKYGYQFTAWYTDEGEWKFDTYRISEDPEDRIITLFAGWSINKYTVIFDTNGVDVYPELENQIVEHGEKAQDPGLISPTGYTFDGWYTSDESDAELWDFDYEVTDNMTLYAKWIPDPET